MPAVMLCRKCGRRLDKFLVAAAEHYHPLCQPVDPNEIMGIDVLTDLIDVVTWVNNSTGRSQQKQIGPSELGSSCERRIAYRIAANPAVNDWTDPWKAIVGTAIHAWMEKSLTTFSKVHHMNRWECELTVHPDPLVVGHCDLYDRDLQMVLDFKTVSASKMKAWKAGGPPENYKDQVQLYGKGLAASGRPVRKVALVAIPRDGTLKDWRIWVDDYQPERAQKALDRLYAIGGRLVSQGSSLDFEAIPANVGDGCAYCPWYRGGSGVADTSGCSGSYADVAAKFGEGIVRG